MQLTLARDLPGAVAVLVTTPQDVALVDVERAIGMFKTLKLHTLGVIENMAGFVCAECGHKSDIFGTGAGARAAEKYGLTNFGSVPLTEKVVRSGDGGKPIVLSDPEDSAAVALHEISTRIAQQIAIYASKEELARA